MVRIEGTGHLEQRNAFPRVLRSVSFVLMLSALAALSPLAAQEASVAIPRQIDRDAAFEIVREAYAEAYSRAKRGKTWSALANLLLKDARAFLDLPQQQRVAVRGDVAAVERCPDLTPTSALEDK